MSRLPSPPKEWSQNWAMQLIRELDHRWLSLLGTVDSTKIPASFYTGSELITASDFPSGAPLGRKSVVFINNNSGAAYSVLPPSSPTNNLVYTIIDYAGNAGTHNISFTGTIQPGSVVNPTIIGTNGASAVMRFFNTDWRRVR